MFSTALFEKDPGRTKSTSVEANGVMLRVVESVGKLAINPYYVFMECLLVLV